MILDTFNIRVYAVLEKENKVLLIKEKYAGKMVVKFPGGGLEFGESTTECLKREFKEELNIEVSIEKHIYTQDFLLSSSLRLNEQLLTIYYKVNSDLNNFEVLDTDIEEVLWVEKSKLNDCLSLPADIIVGDLLSQKLN